MTDDEFLAQQDADAKKEAADLKAAIQRGAKAAREVGKSRTRTFEIGEGLLAMRSTVLKALGKDPRLNDRAILKSTKYRDLMSKALKTYPDYTLDTVFKNDSTRLAYLFCAEYRPQIEAVFADAEIANPGSTIRIVNPERIKAKFKALTDPPRVKENKKAEQAEAEAQERDENEKQLRVEAEDWKRKYEELKVEYDRLWDETHRIALPAPSGSNDADALDMQTPAKKARTQRRIRKAKKATGYIVGNERADTMEEATEIAERIHDETGVVVSIVAE